MADKTYVVTGLTCGHCVSSVSQEVSQATGVRRVAVDLPGSRIIVSGDGYTDEAIAAAVDEAGYALVDA